MERRQVQSLLVLIISVDSVACRMTTTIAPLSFCGKNLDRVIICQDHHGRAVFSCIKPGQVSKVVSKSPGSFCGPCPTMCDPYRCTQGGNRGDRVYVCDASPAASPKTRCVKEGKDNAIVLGNGSYCGRCSDEVILDLFSDDGSTATAAYTNLYEIGLQAIGPLLEMADSEHEYIGELFHDFVSSIVQINRAPIGLVALYIIESILYGTLTPHLGTFLYEEIAGAEVRSDPFKDAAVLYWQWWETNKELSLEELRSVPHPLAGTFMYWRPSSPRPTEDSDGKARRLSSSTCDGGPYNSCAQYEIQERCPTGPERKWIKDYGKDDSCTPIKKGAEKEFVDGHDCDIALNGGFLGNLPTTFEWRVDPFFPSNKVYNCLAIALGVDTWWIEPPARIEDSVTLRQWQSTLEAYNYESLFMHACNTPCDEGLGPQVLMVFDPQYPWSRLWDTNFRHAIVQQEDGSWSSKNGYYYLFENFTNYNEFLDFWYRKPDDAHRQERVCYCKKSECRLRDGCLDGRYERKCLDPDRPTCTDEGDCVCHCEGKQPFCSADGKCVACRSGTDCDDGSECVAGACKFICPDGDGCPPSSVCKDGECVPPQCDAGNAFKRRVVDNRCSGATTWCSAPGSFTCYCDNPIDDEPGCFSVKICGSGGCDPVCSGKRCRSSICVLPMNDASLTLVAFPKVCLVCARPCAMDPKSTADC